MQTIAEILAEAHERNIKERKPRNWRQQHDFVMAGASCGPAQGEGESEPPVSGNSVLRAPIPFLMFMQE